MPRVNVRSQQPGDVVTPRVFSQAQRYTQDALDELFRLVPWMSGKLLASETDAGGRLLDGITFAAGVQKRVPHRLRQRARGWFVVRDFGANAEDLREVTSDANALVLVATVDCTVYLWAWGG